MRARAEAMWDEHGGPFVFSFLPSAPGQQARGSLHRSLARVARCFWYVLRV